MTGKKVNLTDDFRNMSLFRDGYDCISDASKKMLIGKTTLQKGSARKIENCDDVKDP